MTVKEMVEFLKKIPHQDSEVRLADYSQGQDHHFGCTQITLRTHEFEPPIIVLG